MTRGAAGPVLVAVDGTPGTDGAVRYGVREAINRRTSLHLVHVAPSYPPTNVGVPDGSAEFRAVGRTILDSTEDMVRELAPDLALDTELRIGSRVSGIVGAAHAAQLVILGRDTRRQLDRVASGSVTAAVASQAGSPVVAVPSFWSAQPPRGPVVLGVTSSTDLELVTHAFQTACARGVDLILVTAWQLPDPYLDRIERQTHAAERVRDGLATLERLAAAGRSASPEVQVDLRVVHGRPASVLLEAASAADLLMIGRRRHGIQLHERLGGTAHAVLRLAEIPVEVVPPTQPA